MSALHTTRQPYEQISWKDRLQPNGKLASALVKAQAKATALLRDKKNPSFDRPYTPSEVIIGESKDLLNSEGLALLALAFESLPEDNLVECDAKTTFILRGVTIRRWFKLIHSSGEFEIIGPYDWPTNPNKGAPTNTAFASTDTFSLAYIYRDVLGFPRLTAQEIKILEAEEERAIMEANQKKAPVAVPAAAPVATVPHIAHAPAKQIEAPKEVIKPVEITKPAEAKPAEVKPAEVKPAEVKPAEVAKPVEPTKAEPVKAAEPAKVAEPAKPVESQTITLAPAVPATQPVELKNIGDEMVSMLESDAAKRAAQPAMRTASEIFPNPAPPAVVAPVSSGAATSTPTTTAATPTATGSDDILKARQASMLARLQAFGAKTLKENGGDATAFGALLNATAGTDVMVDGRFKRSGLTSDGMKKLEPMLQKAGL
jgi:hypothetical protein